MESLRNLLLEGQKKSVCSLCSCEATDLLNYNDNNFSQILHNYSIYLKPYLSSKDMSMSRSSINWLDTEEKIRFCSLCFTAGQKLSSLSKRLKETESKIQYLIEQVARKILKYRHSSEINLTTNPSPTSTFDNATSENKDELSPNQKFETEIKQEIKLEAVDPIDGAFYIHNFPAEDIFDGNVDDLMSAADDFYLDNLNEEAIDDYSTNEGSGFDTHCNDQSPSLSSNNKKFKALKDAALDNIKTRQLVVLLERLQFNSSGNLISQLPAEKKCQENQGQRMRLNRKSKMKVDLKKVFESDESDSNEHSNKEISDDEYDSDFEIDDDDYAANEIHSPTQQNSRNFNANDNDERVAIKCRICDEEFSDEISLKRHRRFTHAPKQTLKCNLCPQLPTFPDLYEYEIHCMAHNGQIPYECIQCHKKFSNLKDYCKHQISTPCTNSTKQFSCNVCDAVFPAKCLLLNHTAIIHKNVKKTDEGFYPCELCEKSNVKYLPALEYHYAEHTEEFLYSCDICCKPVRTHTSLDTHRKTHRVKTNFKCPICYKTCKTKNSLCNHMKCRHPENDDDEELQCELCGKSIQNKRKYKDHVMHCGQSFTCKVCGKVFKRSENLKAHLLLHDGIIPTCKDCGKTFTTKGALKEHMHLTHLKSYEFICEQCGKKFPSKSSYITHLKSHIQEEPFQCEFCGANYKNQASLGVHLRTHTGEKLVCKFCGEAFMKYEKRRKHMETVHPDQFTKKYKCSVCGMCFEKRWQQYRHRNEVHKDLVVTKVSKECHLCHKVFYSRQILKKHLQRHERDKDGDFHCELCDRRFVFSKSLMSHRIKDHKIIKTPKK